jgi:hypothetical protein
LQDEKDGLADNLRLGLRVGLIMATGFALWATVVRVALGPVAFERFGVGWLQIIGAYYAALSLGGAVYGALYPLRRHVLASVLMGIALMFSLYLGVGVLLNLSKVGSTSLLPTLTDALVLGSVGGALLGLWLWVDERKDSADGRGPPAVN